MSDADPGGIESRDSKDSELALLRLEAGSTRSPGSLTAFLNANSCKITLLLAHLRVVWCREAPCASEGVICGSTRCSRGMRDRT